MVIKINYTSSDVYVSTSVSPVYVVVNYSSVNNGGGAVWGGITGTLSDQTDLQTALDDKVPYTGATTNVNLGEFELKAGQVEFDQTPTGAAGVAVMRWNDSDGTVDLGLKGGNVTLQVGQEQILRVVNKTGANLLESQYRAVRIRLAAEGGSQGQRLAVVLAQGNNDTNSTDTIGIVTENITDNQEGFICTSGIVRGINTTGSLQGETWADGDVIYLSPTIPGAITKVKPTAPDHSVVLGYVIYAHNVNGKIFVKCETGYEIGELHDVYAPTPSNNDGIFWNTANSRYQNNSIAGVLGYTPISGSGVTGQVAYWNGTNSQTGSNNLFWDAANARLGIGTNTPADKVDINGGLVVRGDILARTTGSTFLYLRANDTTGVAGVRFARESTGAQFGKIDYDFATDRMIFRSGGNDRMYLTSVGNLLLNTTTDGGQRLQVQGDAFIKGSGATSATTALTVQNSAGNNMFRIANNGAISLGNSSLRASIFTFTTNQGVIDFSGTNLSFYNSTSNLSATSGAFAFGGDSFFQTTGNQLFFSINMTFVPTSGTATFASLNLSPGINQTGGANGITRGLYVNPILTSAADWRSIEWSNNSGWGLYGAGTAPNYLGGRLTVGSVSANSIYALNVEGILNVSRATGNPAISFNNNAALSSSIAYLEATASELHIYAHTGRSIRFTSGANASRTMTLTANQRLLLGTETESTFLLDVNGTARVSGNVTISSGTTSQGVFIGSGGSVRYTSESGVNTTAIYCSGNTTTQDVLVSYVGGNATSNINSYIQSSGYIGTKGGLRLGAASGTDVISALTNTWLNVAAGTTARSQINLASSTAPTSPVNGDIWFTGTELKIQVGGVTKTFTLV